MKYKQITLITIFLILVSCEYDPKGLYEVEIKKVADPPALTINLNFASDTIYLPLNGYVKFVYFTTDSMVRYAYFELNNKQLSLNESDSGTFSIEFNSDLYKANVAYLFKVGFFRSSGSGSLADKIHQEGFVYSKEFTLIFSNIKFSSSIVSLEPDKGSLLIKWEKFKGVGFKRYHVFNGSFYKPAIISDQDENFCYDPSFIGKGSFYIVTETDNGTFSGPVRYINDINLAVTTSVLSDGKVKISWIKSKYPDNLAGYKIYRYIKETGETNEIAFLTDPLDTNYIASLGIFAVSVKFYVKSIPKIKRIPSQDDATDLQSTAGVTEYFKMGKKLPQINWGLFVKSQGDNCYYPSYQSNIVTYKFNSANHIITDSIPNTYSYLSLSPDGNNLLLRKNDQMELVDPISLETKDVIPSSSLPDGKLPIQFLISNTNIGVFFNDLGNYYYFDFNNKTVLAQFRNTGMTTFGDRMTISPDGKYFCILHYINTYPNYNAELYKLEGGEAKKIWTQNTSNFIQFYPDNNNLLYFNNKTLYTLSTDNLSIVSELLINDAFLYDIDWSRMEFISLNAEKNMFSICDFTSGRIKTQVPTRNFGLNYYTEYLFLKNKTIYIQELYLKLDYPD
jgi:hypothetical protein